MPASLGFQLDMAMLLRQARRSSLVSKHLIGLRCPWLRHNAAVSSLTSKSGPENGGLGAGETNTDIGVVDAAAETRFDDSGETLGMVEDILAGGFEVGGAARKYAETKAKLLADYKNKRSSKAKMYIEIKSFDSLSRFNLGNLRNAHVVGLPTTRSLYTVLRSPHIDKKSREQFETRVHKTLVVIDTQAHKMEDKLKWLLRHDIPGVQLKVTCHYQTRLAMPPPSNAS